MAHALKTSAHRGEDFPATARLRAEILISPSAEALVSMFGQALDEHGIDGHFCLHQSSAGFVPLLGDSPELIAQPPRSIIVDTGASFMVGTRVILAPPAFPLDAEQMARLRGYAQLFAARAMALQELADDVETDCGLSLRERYVLGRRLAGLAPVDIALESDLTVATIGITIERAIDRLGVATLAEATSFAARRGWLAVTSLHNCSSSSEKLRYKATQNG